MTVRGVDPAPKKREKGTDEAQPTLAKDGGGQKQNA